MAIHRIWYDVIFRAFACHNTVTAEATLHTFPVLTWQKETYLLLTSILFSLPCVINLRLLAERDWLHPAPRVGTPAI